jgi:hypothetical protein
MGEEHTEERTPCVVCGLRPPRNPPACELCRHRLAARLWEIRDLHALLPAALEPGQGETQRVSGSREAPLPLRLAALDLAGEARAGVVKDVLLPKVRTWFDPEVSTDRDGFWFGGWHRQRVLDEEGKPVLVGAHDQDGMLPVATVLDSWAREWAEFLGQPLPAAEVPALVSWLSIHLRPAIDGHPAIADFAAEITVLLYAMRALLNVSQKPIYLSEACPTCGHTALKRDPGGGDVVCGECRRTWEHDEWQRLAVVLADDEHAA